MHDITISIVTFNNDKDELLRAIDSSFNTRLNLAVSVVDNSPEARLRGSCIRRGVNYIYTGKNIGF